MPHRPTRRQLLRRGGGSLLAAGLWPGACDANDAGPQEAFSFLVVNDLHYRDGRCAGWFEAVVRQMKGHAERPDFLLVAGDLADGGTAEQLHAARDVLRAVGVPFHVVIGNHDYRARDDRKAYEQAFPDRINYHVEHRGWQLVALDSTDGLRYKDTAVGGPALRWLDGHLPKLDRRRPTVLVTHFPLGPQVTYRPSNADAVLERFKGHNLRAVFCGHWHGLTERRAGDAALTTNRCCASSVGNHDGTKEKGYFLCSARDGAVTRRFVEVQPA